MTEIPPEVFETVAHDALRELAGGSGGAVALEALSGCDVLLPVLGGFHYRAGRPEYVRLLLPALERPGEAVTVAVFTSPERMSAALPAVPCYRPVTLRHLVERWPSQTAALAVNAGGPDELLLPAGEVRQLLLPHTRQAV